MADFKTKPEIRFAGFTDAWEQRKAVDIFKTTADKGYPELPVLSATQDRGMILREDTGINIAHDKKNEATYKRVLPRQFVIHLRSFQGGFAHSNVEGITSPAYAVLDFIEKESHDDWFWKYIFSSESFVKRLETVTYGIRDGRSISYADFSEMSFLYPSSDEQKRIGEAFMTFDNLITLHQREYDKTVNIKKAMLEKMFPKDGEDRPEIRFAGFTDAWEQRKLGNLFQVYSGQTPYRGNPENYDNPTTAWIRTMDLNNSLIQTNDEGISDKAAERLRLLPPGTVLLAMYGGLNQIGRTGLLTYPATINQAISALQPTSEIDSYFLITELNQRIGYWKRIAASSRKDPNITKNDVESFELCYPKLLEQKQIGAFFSNIDNLITLHQRELKKLQNMKKALLEKMFV
ncbi:HsdS specificity protein of type I restriction-modification system [Clostridia bacterium]|nr:HsdS specificity protein of type I restriction-modification system [Clostridia bacterium]